jgi:hypothetical protein
MQSAVLELSVAEDLKVNQPQADRDYPEEQDSG